VTAGCLSIHPGRAGRACLTAGTRPRAPEEEQQTGGSAPGYPGAAPSSLTVVGGPAGTPTSVQAQGELGPAQGREWGPRGACWCNAQEASSPARPSGGARTSGARDGARGAAGLPQGPPRASPHPGIGLSSLSASPQCFRVSHPGGFLGTPGGFLGTPGGSWAPLCPGDSDLFLTESLRSKAADSDTGHTAGTCMTPGRVTLAGAAVTSAEEDQGTEGAQCWRLRAPLFLGRRGLGPQGRAPGVGLLPGTFPHALQHSPSPWSEGGGTPAEQEQEEGSSPALAPTTAPSLVLALTPGASGLSTEGSQTVSGLGDGSVGVVQGPHSSGQGASGERRKERRHMLCLESVGWERGRGTGGGSK